MKTPKPGGAAEVYLSGPGDIRLIALGVWESVSGDYFVCQRFSTEEIDLLMFMTRFKQNPSSDGPYRPVVVDLDTRVRDLICAAKCEMDDAGRNWPDHGIMAHGRPPIGSAGRINPVNATTARVIGKKKRKTAVLT